jgi:hypothetical protein
MSTTSHASGYKKNKKDATPAKRRCDTASQILGVPITTNNSNPKHPAWRNRRLCVMVIEDVGCYM